MEPFESNLSRIQSIAAKKGWVLNPDEKRIQKVVGLMADNFTDHGDYYCPCKQSGESPKPDDVLCPCPDAEKEITEAGHCYCRLFYRPNAIE